MLQVSALYVKYLLHQQNIYFALVLFTSMYSVHRGRFCLKNYTSLHRSTFLITYIYLRLKKSAFMNVVPI